MVTLGLSRAAAWAVLLGWMGLIFLVSHQPAEALIRFERFDLVLKKAAHFVAYAMLALLAAVAAGGWRPSLILTALYAVSDEYHQTFVAGRTGSGLDVGIDTCGGLFAWMMHRIWIGSSTSRGL